MLILILDWYFRFLASEEHTYEADVFLYQIYAAGSISPKNWIYFFFQINEKFLEKYVPVIYLKPESLPTQNLFPILP